MRILAHLDDVGVSAGSVIAWKALRRAGVVTTASVMVPCPFYPMAVADALEEPEQDLGIHLTLTSEWSAYRWRPLIGGKHGLTDADGFFHHRPEAVAAQADPEAVADEMSAQIERALSDGLKPTHLDAHMGTAYLPPFLSALMKVSARYQIPCLVCRDFTPLMAAVRVNDGDAGPLQEAVAEMEQKSHPVLDRFLISFCPDDREARDHFGTLVSTAGPGTHWLALHANALDDTRHFAPHMVAPRRKEYDLFRFASSRQIFDDAGAEPIGWRHL